MIICIINAMMSEATVRLLSLSGGSFASSYRPIIRTPLISVTRLQEKTHKRKMRGFKRNNNVLVLLVGPWSDYFLGANNGELCKATDLCAVPIRICWPVVKHALPSNRPLVFFCCFFFRIHYFD